MWLRLVTVGLVAAVLPSHAETVPFDSDRWRISARESRVEDHLGRPSLFLRGGFAVLPDVRLLDGELAFDIAFTPERGFGGAVFRLVGDGHYENYYLRPHQSGKPDANQYTPAFHGITAWQLYHGPSYAVPLPYRTDTWMRVRIVFAGGRADIYHDSDKPVLAVDLKRDPQAGAIGVSAFNGEFHFSNFSYRSFEEPADGQAALVGQPHPEPAAPAGVVEVWDVSNAFPEAQLDGVTDLAAAPLPDLTWQELHADAGTGITNLARRAGTSDEGDTVLARTTLRAAKAEWRRLRFGYSDRARVFVNGRPVYRGDNGYRSRDYRFLGTIGLFDEIVLPLRPGENEVVFAVSESFGGWGLLAVLPAGG